MRVPPLLSCLVVSAALAPAQAQDSEPLFTPRSLDLTRQPAPAPPVDRRFALPASPPYRFGEDPATVRFAPDNRAAPGRSANAPDWLHLSPPADTARQEMEQAARRGHYDPAYWPARPPCRLCLICHRFGRQRAPCRTGP